MNLFMNKSLMLLVGLLIISRLIGLPTNFSPMLAVAIFMPRLTSRKSIQSFLPAGVMLLTSIFLPPVDLLNLFCIIFIFLITPIVSRQTNNLVYSCISNVLLWFFVVNGAVWISGGGSLIEIYIAAIPFDFRLLLSTSLYLLLFNSLEKFVKAHSQHNKKILDS